VSFVVQRVTGRGLALSELEVEVLRIGRGTSAELRSDNPAVALEHAAIEEDVSGYFVTDKGSITGTYVNRKPVETARLAKGDVIEIGDLRLEVQLAEVGRPMFLRITSTASRPVRGGILEEDDPPEGITAPIAPIGPAIKAPRIDYATAFRLDRPYFKKITLTALLTIVALAITAEVLRPENQTAFMPGGVSSAHAHARSLAGKPVAADCQACHDPWRGVVDERCSGCHTQGPHALTQKETPPCISCHAEHRERPKLALMDEARCIACHRDLTAQVKAGTVVPPELLHVDSFGGGHPDFHYPDDPDTLRFNHRLHLQAGGIFDGRGRRQVLACTGCHKLIETRGKLDPKPVKFATDCQGCHKLTFDSALPDEEVPHAGDLYGSVVAMYAGNGQLASKSPDEIRRILTARTSQNVDARAIVAAEQVIKTKCAKCHEIVRKGQRMVAVPPVVRTQWISRVHFSHTRHVQVPCERCHESARRSTTTREVLMPVRAACLDCHGSAKGNTASGCVTCHDYHGQTRTGASMVTAGMISPRGPLAGMAGDGYGMLGTILLCAIVVLLLVVLVPLGVVLYQRLRVVPPPAARSAAPTAPRVAVPPLPTPAPSAKPEPSPSPVAASPTERAMPAVSAPKATVVAPLDFESTVAARGSGEPGATEMVQWNGMLSCTAGALEGQRWIIEDQGLYIGRDSTMAQVVILDSHISKRHVRILPRDGHVWAIDQGSTNGTFLGKTGTPRITEVQLKRGDVLILGDNVASFLYQI
jgi:pSer/pThr/pTyr-binding forkhead associated (FHA) protein